MIELGYTKEDIIKMTKKFPSIYSYSVENTKQKITDMVELGYSKEEVIKMTKMYPIIYGYSIETIKHKIEDIISLGYSKEEVIKMTKYLPSLYTLSKENMKQKIENLINLGYSKDEIIIMTKKLPQMYNLGIENISQKLEFYESIELREMCINDTKQLMQSVDLSYARYKFLENREIFITMQNYKLLFISQKQFEKQFGITKSEILELYNYKEEKERRK